MSVKLIAALSVAALAVTFAPPASAQSAATPSAFVISVYQALRSQNPDHPALARQRVYSASLIALMAAADRAAVASGNEIGALDFDPLCNCQDIISAFGVKMIEQNATNAKALVRTTNAGDGSQIWLSR